MLGTALDIFRLRQYFNVITRTREIVDGVREDAGLVNDARRALVPLPLERRRQPNLHPFPPTQPLRAADLKGRRLGLVVTGGSGALASVVGAARALEEAGVRPAIISLCSGSALFGFPIAAGIPADQVADFTLGLRPDDYVDVDWRMLASLLPRAAKGFAGIVRGERIEATYRRLLGDMTLAEMPIPAYAPIWNIEHNRLEYIGPRTYPDMSVARAVHMAIALPLFIEPVMLGGGYWCDGGIVDIFPVRPILDIEEPPEVVLAINGFYPPGFVGENASGWQDRRASILYVASQVRTCQQAELARTNLTRLEQETDVMMIEPVPYAKVRGAGFYRQFLNTTDWPEFMRAGRLEARRVLTASAGSGASARSELMADRPRTRTRRTRPSVALDRVDGGG
ncbi:MAG TPA: patatin-like phospholipase family protein [Acidimicrobiales bacterium]|nr:patatin-like phospholipase family protein [Acidimicrobiales bacterium]